MKEPASCGDCAFLKREERVDFHPGSHDYTCTLVGCWIGFADRRLTVCLPVINEKCESCQLNPSKYAAGTSGCPTA